jgi:hypothetical protein
MVTYDIPLGSAGGDDLQNTATGGGNEVDHIVDVQSTDVDVTKDCSPDTGNSNGDIITCTITVSNGANASPATGVVIVDQVDVTQSLQTAVAAGYTCNIAPAYPAPSNVATCNAGPDLAPGGSVILTTTAEVVDAAAFCTDTASVTNTNSVGDPAADNEVDGSVQCAVQTVTMNKFCPEGTDNPDIAGQQCNLWVTVPPTMLVIPEVVAGAALADDPQGVGAFEFQVKFDHKVFDIIVCEGNEPLEDTPADPESPSDFARCDEFDEPSPGDPPVDDDPADHWLYSTGRDPVNALGVGGCQASIVTENWILFGCVSKDDPDTPAMDLGPQVGGIAATLFVSPEPDLVNRLTPGQKNGIVRTILDENCELADIFGDPLADADGDPLPGIVNGGLVEECGDITVTVRMLEGDLDLDCDVDVADDQAIAFRYGGFFGMLLYDPFFDLEPPLKDFDIDIKDLQKVFGRNGSTCENPIPDQDPQPGPPAGPNPGPNP